MPRAWPLCVLLFSAPAPAGAEVPSARPSPDAELAAVVDAAGYLTESEVREMTTELRAIQARTGIPVFLRTVPSLNGASMRTAPFALLRPVREAHRAYFVALFAAREDESFDILVGPKVTMTPSQIDDLLVEVLYPPFREARYLDGFRATAKAIEAALPQAATLDRGWIRDEAQLLSETERLRLEARLRNRFEDAKHPIFVRVARTEPLPSSGRTAKHQRVREAKRMLSNLVEGRDELGERMRAALLLIDVKRSGSDIYNYRTVVFEGWGPTGEEDLDALVADRDRGPSSYGRAGAEGSDHFVAHRIEMILFTYFLRDDYMGGLEAALDALEACQEGRTDTQGLRTFKPGIKLPRTPSVVLGLVLGTIAVFLGLGWLARRQR